MQVLISEVKGNMPAELENATNDLLKNATNGMMSWAERNYKQKLIDILYHMGYYKYNQTIYLSNE